MPNWCQNIVTLNHPDSAMIARADAAVRNNTLFEEFSPLPAGEDWYKWRIARWGTKWDVCDADVHYATTTRLVVEFNTAWAPPEKFYETLVSLGFTVNALYNEFGNGFCGIFTNDSTTADGTCYVEYHQMMTDEERSQHIPSVLLETFHINEMCNDE
jgi:hypothetical protein